MSPHVLKALALVGVPATLIAGVADWYADGAGPDWVDAVVGTLAVLGATANLRRPPRRPRRRNRSGPRGRTRSSCSPRCNARPA